MLTDPAAAAGCRARQPESSRAVGIAPRRRHHRGRVGVAGAWRFQGPHHGLAAATSMAAISGIRTPPRPSGAAIWRSAGRPPSESASQRLSKGLPIPRGYSKVPPTNPKKRPRQPFSASLAPQRAATPAPPRTTPASRRRRGSLQSITSPASTDRRFLSQCALSGSAAVRTAAEVLKEVLAGAGSSLGPLLPQAAEGE